MATDGTSFVKLGVAAIGLVTLSIVSLMGIAVLQGFEDAGVLTLENISGTMSNANVDNFIAGLAIFGTFSTILAIAIVGKLVIALFRTK